MRALRSFFRRRGRSILRVLVLFTLLIVIDQLRPCKRSEREAEARLKRRRQRYEAPEIKNIYVGEMEYNNETKSYLLIIDPIWLEQYLHSKLGTNSLKSTSNSKRPHAIKLTDHDLKADYIRFRYNDTVRAFVQFSLTPIDDVFYIPQNISWFLRMFPHSVFQECDEERVNSFFSDYPEQLVAPAKLSKESFRGLVAVRDIVNSLGYFTVMSSGTFLGWFRECRLIPHTHDFDVMVPTSMMQNVEREVDVLKRTLICDTRVHLEQTFGHPKNGFELTSFIDVKGKKVKTDVFILYDKDTEFPYIGTVGFEVDPPLKLREQFARFTGFCTADLLGHLFHVPCNSKEVIQWTYGLDSWRMPNPDFSYAKHPRGLVHAGRYTKEEYEATHQLKFICNDSIKFE